MLKNQNYHLVNFFLYQKKIANPVLEISLEFTGRSTISRSIHFPQGNHSIKIISAATSNPNDSWLFCLSSDSHLFAFDLQKNDPPHILNLISPSPSLSYQEGTTTSTTRTTAARQITGLAVHHHRNHIATFGDSDILRLWKP
mmetsp:Transcript_20581/g.25578  ORF Transcript_20581/g.25578 Transcript_20581/m.25578 type:complete len:142 (+) Transcript_20581:838-1263(+)